MQRWRHVSLFMQRSEYFLVGLKVEEKYVLIISLNIHVIMLPCDYYNNYITELLFIQIKLNKIHNYWYLRRALNNITIIIY